MYRAYVSLCFFWVICKLENFYSFVELPTFFARDFEMRAQKEKNRTVCQQLSGSATANNRVVSGPSSAHLQRRCRKYFAWRYFFGGDVWRCPPNHWQFCCCSWVYVVFHHLLRKRRCLSAPFWTLSHTPSHLEPFSPFASSPALFLINLGPLVIRSAVSSAEILHLPTAALTKFVWR